MIHTIETLPIVTFVKIAETNEVKRLLKYYPNNKHLSRFVVWAFKLEDKWRKICEEYNKHEDNKKNKKIQSLKVKLSKQQGKYYAIIAALEVLKYGSNDKMLEILKRYGYVIKGEYWRGLETIYKQVSNLKNKIEGIRDEIKKYSEVDDVKDVSIYKILSRLMIGLEISFKTNELTTIEYIFFRKELQEKIKTNNKLINKTK